MPKLRWLVRRHVEGLSSSCREANDQELQEVLRCYLPHYRPTLQMWVEPNDFNREGFWQDVPTFVQTN